VVFLDKRVTLFLNLRENESGLLIFLSHLGNIIGDGKYLFSILTTGALVSLLLKNTKIKNLFYLSLCSSLILSALNFVFKAICHRQRPHTEYNPYLFFAFKKAFVEGKLFTNTYGSLPSGHTISLTGACIIFALYFKNIYFKAFFLILPFLTGVARICTRKHWLSDILISYVIGALFAVSIYKYNSSKFK
jgi:membrane-associated phospholipid phosphatase